MESLYLDTNEEYFGSLLQGQKKTVAADLIF